MTGRAIPIALLASSGFPMVTARRQIVQRRQLMGRLGPFFARRTLYKAAWKTL
jgi:hypothetical protein